MQINYNNNTIIRSYSTCNTDDGKKIIFLESTRVPRTTHIYIIYGTYSTYIYICMYVRTCMYVHLVVSPPFSLTKFVPWYRCV